MSALPEEIINALSDDQFDTTAAYLSGSHEKDDMPTVCKKVKCFNLPKKSLKGLRLSAIFQLWKYCKEQQFDVIITHRFKPLYVVLIVNKLLKKPAFCISVLHANNGFDRLYRRLLTRLFTDKYWTYVGVSESVKKNLFFAFPCKHRVLVILNNRIHLNGASCKKSYVHSRRVVSVNQKGFV